VKFSSVVSIQIFSLKNANCSFNEIHVENVYFPLPFKWEMHFYISSIGLFFDNDYGTIIPLAFFKLIFPNILLNNC
jgi:hypothetical protein